MKIGEFARLGQVSVRMLRHYESLGLLQPHQIDPFSSHRSYSVVQLTRLNRIMALNSLGIPLRKVAELLDVGLSTSELVDMLELRRHQLLTEQTATATALADVEFRLALIERTTMDHPDCIIKDLPAERIVGATVVLGEPPFDTSEIGPLFAHVAQQIAIAGSEPDIGVGLYTDTEAGTEVTCGYRATVAEGPNAAALNADELPVGEPHVGEPRADQLHVTELPTCTAATLIHGGPIGRIGASWQHLSEWCLTQGYSLVGPCREVYLQDGTADDNWVIELQQPITN